MFDLVFLSRFFTKMMSFCVHQTGNFLNFSKLTLLLSLVKFWCPLRPFKRGSLFFLGQPVFEQFCTAEGMVVCKRVFVYSSVQTGTKQGEIQFWNRRTDKLGTKTAKNWCTKKSTKIKNVEAKTVKSPKSHLVSILWTLITLARNGLFQCLSPWPGSALAIGKEFRSIAPLVSELWPFHEGFLDNISAYHHSLGVL